jgi:hypothetical protein
MTPILIGSRALQFWEPSLKLKETTDFDVISDSPISGCEFHDAEFLNNHEMKMYQSTNKVILPDGTKCHVMNLTGLAIIKRSHLWRSLNFDRHITFYHKFGLADTLKHDIVNNPLVSKVLERRIHLTKEAFPQGNPNLMLSKEDFFDDFVTKKYDHDFLHELVAFYDKPLYTRLLRNSELAWCEKEKWDSLSDSDKIKCVAEETFVIAIERFMVPNGWKFPSKLAYMKALNKVCTTLCSGWFRDFAIDFYPEIVTQYNSEIFDSVRTTLKE